MPSVGTWAHNLLLMTLMGALLKLLFIVTLCVSTPVFPTVMPVPVTFVSVSMEVCRLLVHNQCRSRVGTTRCHGVGPLCRAC